MAEQTGISQNIQGSAREMAHPLWIESNRWWDEYDWIRPLSIAQYRIGTRHKLATAPQRAKQRMAEFCGLQRERFMWQKPAVLLHYGKQMSAKSLKRKWRERPDLNRRPLP
jgi:hypothetical protein